MLGDDLVELGLGEAGLVRLVVPVPPVAQQVDEDVGVELLAVVQGQLRRQHHRLDVVGVDVEHGRQRHLGHIGAVGAGTAVEIIGGEAELVVGHQVDGAARAVAVQQRHLDDLVDHALGGHGRIAVDEHRQHPRRVAAVFGVEAGPGDALDHRVHRLEMRRVVGELHAHRAAVGRGHLPGVTQVVLDIACEDVVAVALSLELLENVVRGLVHDVGQHVEPAAVGHADDHVRHPAACAGGDQRLQRRDEGLVARQREALLAREPGVEEIFEDHRPGESFQDTAFGLGGEPGPVAGGFDPVQQPSDALGVPDEHELDADGRAVRLLEVGDDLAERRRAETDLGARLESLVQVLRSQPEVGDVEGGRVRPPCAHRVRPGEEVAAGAVAMNEVDHPELGRIEGGRAVGGAGRGVRCSRRRRGLPEAQVEAAEEVTPARVHPGRVGGPFAVERVHELRVGAEQEGVTGRIPIGGIGGVVESVCGCLVGHSGTLPSILSDRFSDVKQGQPDAAGSRRFRRNCAGRRTRGRMTGDRSARPAVSRRRR